jgi:tetratricopeptide (TPR) repeat protein
MPEDPGLESHIRHWLGASLEAVGRSEEAESQYRQAQHLRKQLEIANPGDASIQSSLAHVDCYLAKVLASSGRADEAVKVFQQAVEIQEKLLKDHPEFSDPGRIAGDTYRYMGSVLFGLHCLEEAEKALRRSVEVHAGLVANAPGELRICESLAWDRYLHGTVLFGAAKPIEACQAFQAAFGILARLQAEHPEVADFQCELAWMLLDCPAPHLQDPARAVALASQGVRLAHAPGVEQNWTTLVDWTTLGMAQYRAGDPRASIESLQKTGELPARDDPERWLFLAMAYWKTGERHQAEKWYDKAAVWMDVNRPARESFDRLRAEAAELLGKGPILAR